jgi:hypothetical protein
MEDFLRVLQDRLDKKLHKAEQAYVRQKTQQCTLNCIHKGRNLTPAVSHCNISAMGNSEQEATQCWDEKSLKCPVFKLKKTAEQLKLEFRQISQSEISLRWPAIGELYWIKSKLEEFLSKGNTHAEWPDT